MEKTFLPGDVRQRLTDLMKDRKVTQTELARKIGCGDSVLSRFISGQTDKLSNENIIRIARVFNVSTDFLLGITNVPDRKNYAIDELGLSAEAARNLFTEKVNTAVLNRLLESPRFAEANIAASPAEPRIRPKSGEREARGFREKREIFGTPPRSARQRGGCGKFPKVGLVRGITSFRPCRPSTGRPWGRPAFLRACRRSCTRW